MDLRKAVQQILDALGAALLEVDRADLGDRADAFQIGWRMREPVTVISPVPAESSGSSCAISTGAASCASAGIAMPVIAVVDRIMTE
ncbi:MAG: hypothetical protein WDN24_02470 [Sphingomonas sp.]